jgi:hypothetical protein
MKTIILAITVLGAALTFLSQPAMGQGRVSFGPSLSALTEVDFEDVDVSPRQGPGEIGPQIPNPLTLNGVTFTAPQRIGGGYCSSPTCQPDPDNASGGNIVLFLNPGSTISFEQSPKRVVLDIQGMGNGAFVMTATDGRGRKRRVRDRGTLYGVTLVRLSSEHGIRQVTVNRVARRGEVSLARVLFSPTEVPTWPGGVVPHAVINTVSVRAWRGD